MKAPREEHLADPRAQFRAVAWVLGPLTVLAVVLYALVDGPVGVIPILGCLLSWGAYGGSVLLQRSVVDPIGEAAGRLLMPSGSSTPPPKPLSHIEAMVARGDLGKAAEAYKAEILSDPADVTSCERLGTLALRELKDFPLAVWAYREAERRAETAGRKFGYGLIVAGIYRDQFRDLGKTVVELRRLVHTYPDAPRLDSLRAEIDELKAGMFDEPAG
ncbi:MAG: hypothetical protein AAB409_06300 [Gemmatimonadota bacterium]